MTIVGNITVLTGGVGGAKLVLGLSRVVPPENVTAIVNTGDDFHHFWDCRYRPTSTRCSTPYQAKPIRRGVGDSKTKVGPSWTLRGASARRVGSPWVTAT